MPRHLPKIDDIERLLIVKTSSIGDVIHALPVVESIKKARPGLTIGWVVRRRCENVLVGNPCIDHLHVVENKPSLGDLARVRRELTGLHYQCALDMQGLFLSGVYTMLSGAPVRIGLDLNREMNTVFLTHQIPTASPAENAGKSKRGERHAVDILYGFAEALGVTSEHSEVASRAYAPSHGEFGVQPYLSEVLATETLQQVERLPSPRIALNVGASSKYKQWPTSHWIALADGLVNDGYNVVFVGDGRDAMVVGEVVAGMSQSTGTDHVVNAAGKTSIRELAALLSRCAVVVTGDTGPMHIAVAVGTPTVALFGSTNPTRTGPYGKRNVVLNMHLSCSPCYRRPTCDGRVDCMTAITPESVHAAIGAKLMPAGEHA